MKYLRAILEGILFMMLFAFTSYADTGEAVICWESMSIRPGKEFTLSLSLQATPNPGAVRLVLSYDPDVLAFTGGSNSNGGNGQLVFVSVSDGSSEEMTFSAGFKALAEGEAKLALTEFEVLDYQSEEEMSVSVVPGEISVAAEEKSSVETDGSFSEEEEPSPQTDVPAAEGFSSGIGEAGELSNAHADLKEEPEVPTENSRSESITEPEPQDDFDEFSVEGSQEEEVLPADETASEGSFEDTDCISQIHENEPERGSLFAEPLILVALVLLVGLAGYLIYDRRRERIDK